MRFCGREKYKFKNFNSCRIVMVKCIKTTDELLSASKLRGISNILTT